MAYFMALTIKFLERTKQCNENFLYTVWSWFSDRNSNWVDSSYKSNEFLWTKCPYIVMQSLVVLLWSAALYLHIVIVMVSCFILSRSRWWHFYGQLLYTFRQSMVALLWSAALYFHVVTGGIVMISCFILSGSQWWHCYDQLLYTFT